MINRLAGKLLCLLLLFQAFGVTGQIAVSTDPPYNDPVYLIRDVSLGIGVKVSNITYYGHPKQLGYFENTADLFGFNSGIILSSGAVKQAEVDPVGCANFEVPANYPNAGRGDPDLLAVAQLVPVLTGQNFPVESTQDAAIIEFDFYMESDSITFRYVFASEEYLAWKNTKYNDVFGFFVSGPGISGPYSSPPNFPDGSINIGLIPGTNFPITISTVNDETNSQYYVDNGGHIRDCEQADMPNAKIEYNGFTRTITAGLKVRPCETYHIKLAIADGTKNDLDSGVLLEARSFSSGRLKVDRKLGYTVRDTVVVEGCAEPAIVLTRLGSIDKKDSVRITLNPASTAAQSDIAPFPEYAVFQPGEETKIFPVTVVNDMIAEGMEELLFDVELLGQCVSSFYKVRFDIDDVRPVEFINPSDESYNQVCRGDEVLLDGRARFGYGLYTYEWRANGELMTESDSAIRVRPSEQTTYTVTLRDTCGMGPVTKQFTIIPPNYLPMQVYCPDSIWVTCPADATVLQPDSVKNGSGLYAFRWHFNGALIATTRQTTVYPQYNGMYYLEVLDSCGSMVNDSIFVQLRKYSPIDLFTSADTTICYGDTIELKATASGGAGGFTYLWQPVQLTGEIISVSPAGNSSYQVKATDICDNVKNETVHIDVSKVSASFEFNYINDFEVKLENYSTGPILENTWMLDRDFLSGERDADFRLTDLDPHHVQLTVKDKTGCSDTTEKEILPPIFIYLPSAFTPNNDGINDVYFAEVEDAREFEMVIFDRWGNEMFRSTDPTIGWDGRKPGSNYVVDGVYTVTVKAVRNNKVRDEQIGRITLIR